MTLTSFWCRPRLTRWHGDEAHLAELAGVDDLLDLAHRRAVDEGVADHERAGRLAAASRELGGLGDRRRERLLDEHVLAGHAARPWRAA